MAEKDELHDVLLVFGILFLACGALFILFVIPEILIFGFDQEARDDWMRMLPSAVFDPFLWGMSIFALFSGIYGVWLSFRSKEGLRPLSAPLFLALIYPGVRVPYYWIKRIVIDDVPAFGYNPDNIYAVTGINTIVLGTLWCFQGIIVGLLLFGLMWGIGCLCKGMARLFKIRIEKE